MLLIFFLGLIAKLVLVRGDCNFGSSDVNNFNISKFTGTWYVFYHSTNPFNNKHKCVVLNYATPSLDKFLINVTTYHISKQVQVTYTGYGTNWNSTGYYEIYLKDSIWNGPIQIITTDYSRYYIMKHCPMGLNETQDYMGYRTTHPDAATVNQSMTYLQKKGIDVTKMLNWPVCQ